MHKEPEIDMIRFNITIVLILGSIMYLNCCHLFAPSNMAASYNSESTDIIAPTKRTMFCPKYFHALVATREKLLILVSLSQYGRFS